MTIPHAVRDARIALAGGAAQSGSAWSSEHAKDSKAALVARFEAIMRGSDVELSEVERSFRDAWLPP